MAKSANSVARSASNMNATQQQAVAIAAVATELALSWYGIKEQRKELDAAISGTDATRRETVLKIALDTATAGEVSIKDGTPVQQLFLATFAKEAWKAAGLEGAANTAIKKNDAGLSLPGLSVITSNIKSIFLAANIGKARLLTLRQAGIKEDDAEWNVHEYLSSASGWAMLYQYSVKVRRVAFEAGMLEKGPSSNRGGKGRTIKVKNAVDALNAVASMLSTASDGRQLVREACRCFATTAPTLDARTAIQRLTDEYTASINRYLEPIRNEHGKPAKQQTAQASSATAVAAPTAHVAPDAPDNDAIAAQFAQFQAFLAMQHKPLVPAGEPNANLAAFKEAAAVAKDQIATAASKRRGKKAAAKQQEAA